MIGSTPPDNSRLDAEVIVTLKYLSTFWRSRDLPLINCELELDLSWSRNHIISETSRTLEITANPAANAPVTAAAATTTTIARFQINNTKLYVLVLSTVPVLSLSTVLYVPVNS